MNIRSATNWSVLDRIVNYSITILIGAVLARLIPPEDFGMLAMVTVFTGFFGIFKNFGLSSSLIHYQDTTKKEIDSIFWFIAGVSLLLALLIAAASPAIAAFYDNDKLIPLTLAVAFLFFIQSFGIVPDTLIRKNLDFKNFFYRNLAGNILSGVAGIAFAFLGFGVWALLIKQLVANVWTIFASFKVARYFPSFYFNWDYIKRHLSFGLPLLGERTMNYFTRNVDTMMVGKWMGEKTVGYYNRAYSLMLLPLRQINNSVARVIFPAFAKIDKASVWDFYVKLLRVTTYITFPLMIVMFVLAKEIILILYGPKWAPTVPILKGLSLIGAVQSMTSYSGTMFLVLGKTKQQFKLGLIIKPLTISLIIGGLYFGGIPGLITAYAGASLFSFSLLTWHICKYQGHRFTELLFALRKEFLMGAVLLTSGWLFYRLLPEMNLFVKAAVVGAFMLGVLWAVSRKWDLEGYRFLKRYLKFI